MSTDSGEQMIKHSVESFFDKVQHTTAAENQKEAYRRALAVVEQALGFLDGTQDANWNQVKELDNPLKTDVLKSFVNAMQSALATRHEEICATASRGVLGVGASKNKKATVAFDKVYSAVEGINAIKSFDHKTHWTTINTLHRALDTYQEYLQGKLGMRLKDRAAKQLSPQIEMKKK